MTEPGEIGSQSTHEQKLLRAAEGGDVESMRLLGAHYLRQGYEELAFTYFQKASDAGDPKAMVRVAIARTTGTGVIKSIPVALSLLEIAAKRGNLQAARGLANIHATGQYGQSKKPEEAALWQRLAGEIEAGTYVPDHAYRAPLKMDPIPEQEEEVDGDGDDSTDVNAEETVPSAPMVTSYPPLLRDGTMAALSQPRAVRRSPTSHPPSLLSLIGSMVKHAGTKTLKAPREIARADAVVNGLTGVNPKFMHPEVYAAVNKAVYAYWLGEYEEGHQLTFNDIVLLKLAYLTNVCETIGNPRLQRLYYDAQLHFSVQNDATLDPGVKLRAAASASPPSESP